MTNGRRTLHPALGEALLLALLSPWTVPMPAVAEHPKVDVLSMSQGMPSATIYDLEQDPTGRIWILTRRGITVTDGRSFRTFSKAEGLPEEPFGALAIDAAGDVWTASLWYELRVFHYDGTAWSSLPVPPSQTPRSQATALAVLTGPQRVAVGTRLGDLHVWDGAEWMRHATAPVNDLLAAHGELLVATDGGLCRLADQELDCRLGDREPRLRNPILGLYQTSQDEATGDGLWLLAQDWLGVLRPGPGTSASLEILVEDLVLPPQAERRGTLAVDAAGGVYFGNPARSYYLDPIDRRYELLGSPQGLPEGVSALLVDREDLVWIGTLRGLGRIISRRFLSFDERDGLLEAEVTALAEPQPGRFVLGYNSGLSLFDGRRATPLVRFGPSLGVNDNRVLDMAVTPDGDTWIAAHDRGLLRLPAGGREIESMSMPKVFAVEVDERGQLWVLRQGELTVRDESGFKNVDLGAAPRHIAFLRWLTIGPEGAVYLSTIDGLYWREHGTAGWQRARGPDRDANSVFDTHLVAPSRIPGGAIWAATAAGLFELRDGALVEWSRGGFTIDRPTYFIFEDTNQRFWFGIDDGVLVWDGRRLQRFSVREGLAGRETNRGASLVDHRGRVWIGTEQGLSVFQEHYDLEPRGAPRVEIREVEVNGEPAVLDRPLKLGHRQNRWTFHLDTISHSPARRVLQSYRLAGFDDDWRGPLGTGDSEIDYTNLPPGSYSLQVEARWAEGGEVYATSSPSLVIEPPVWRRAWFLGSGVLLLGLTILGTHLLRTRSLRGRARELERLNAERQRLIDELESRNAELERFTYTVSHDLKTPLVTVEGFVGFLKRDVERQDRERIERDLEQIQQATRQMGRLLHELLELSRVGRVVEPSELVPIAEVVQEALTSVAGPIAAHGVEVEIEEGLPEVLGDRVRLLEVFQNLIDNAAKYMGDQPRPRIEISARDEGERWHFSIGDNGLGVDPRYHEKVFGLFEQLDPNHDGTGIGLTLVRRIIELHGGRIWIESEGRGRGTTFHFTLPRITAPQPTASTSK